MTCGFDLVTMDSADPDGLAVFWCSAIDLVEYEREDGGRWIVLCSSEGSRRLGIQRGEHQAGSMHLDLRCGVDEFDTELERLVRLGAVAQSRARTEPYGRIVNLADPQGNPFDLCAYNDC